MINGYLLLKILLLMVLFKILKKYKKHLNYYVFIL